MHGTAHISSSRINERLRPYRISNFVIQVRIVSAISNSIGGLTTKEFDFEENSDEEKVRCVNSDQDRVNCGHASRRQT